MLRSLAPRLGGGLRPFRSQTCQRMCHVNRSLGLAFSKALSSRIAEVTKSAPFRQHDLRHRRVTVWLAEEKSAALVQEAMGHSDLRTTLGYSHLARTHLKAL